MMKKLIYISTLILPLTTALASCSSNASDAVTYEITTDAPAQSQDASQQPASASTTPFQRFKISDSTADTNSAPYRLGLKHARELAAQVSDTTALNDCLLDINARLSNIQARIGNNAAQDYLHGLRDGLGQTAPSLAKAIF